MRSKDEVNLSFLEPVNWNQSNHSFWVLIGLKINQAPRMKDIESSRQGLELSRIARTGYASRDRDVA
jgi:hypothetical protein